jgi:Tol biopolymer transport system component
MISGTCLLVVVVLMRVALGAQKPDAADTLLQTAIKKEVVDGDLPAAIEGYKKAAASAKGNRVVASMALVHIAQCYQKMGDAQARKIYEQIVREYGDQKEAVTIARAMLATLTGSQRSGGMTARQLWSPSPREQIHRGGVSPDGRYIPFTNWFEHGDLYLHDFQTGANRRLTNTAKDDEPRNSGEFAAETCFSPDGKHLAYTWFVGIKRRLEIRVVDLQAAGIPQPRVLFENEKVDSIYPEDWSPDGKSIAVRIMRDRTSAIGLVSVADGSLRLLKSIDNRFTGKVLFSPDGRYLAFGAPGGESAAQRDIWILAIDQNRETAAVVDPANDMLMGWSPDGKLLLFTSDRGGSTDLWAIPFRNGGVSGPAHRLKKDMGENESKGLSRSGALYHAVLSRNPPLRQGVRIAAIDFETGRFTRQPREDEPGLGGNCNLPAWSPGGKFLAYACWSRSRDDQALVIRGLEERQIRILRLSLSGFSLAQTPISASLSPNGTSPWWPDGRSLVVIGQELTGRQGIFRIDAQSGEASLLAQGAFNYPILSGDAKHLYYRRTIGATGPSLLVSRELSSGTETVLLSRARVGYMSVSPDSRYIGIMAGDDVPAKPESSMTLLLVPVGGGEARELFRGPQLGAVTFSTDGRYVATGSTDPVTNTKGVFLIPVQGGEPRELMRQPEARSVNIVLWAPDSRSIFLQVGTKTRQQTELWRMPVDGGPATKIEGNFGYLSGAFRVSPDRTHLAFDTAFGETGMQAGGPKRELWVLENFLPASDK